MTAEIVNPDESLASLYYRRTHAKNVIAKSKHDLSKATTSYEYGKKQLSDIETKIAIAEKAMTTPGKQVRLF